MLASAGLTGTLLLPLVLVVRVPDGRLDRMRGRWTDQAWLTIRYERKANHFLAFLIFPAAITCFKRLQRLTT